MRRLLACLALCAAAPAGALEPGYATRDLELRSEPLASAPVAGRIAKGARVEVIGEAKAWSQLRAGTLTGWALSFYVMKGEPAAPVGLGQRLSEAVSLGTERRAETSATIGIRGLDEEELKSAQFNAEELRRMEALAVPAAEGQGFAARRGIAARPVDYLKGAAP